MDSTFWIALGSIGTFVMAIATFITLWRYQKEKREKENREISEEIILPIKENIKNLINILKEHRIDNFNWDTTKKNNPILVYRLSGDLKADIGNFNKEFKKFGNIYYQIKPGLEELIYLEIFKRARKKAAKELKEIVTTNQEVLARSYYQWKRGGKAFFVSFYELIFKDETLNEYIDKTKKDSEIYNQQITDGAFIIGGVGKIKEFNKEEFNDIYETLKKETQENPTLQEYINFWREISKKAQNLL
ncbi:MAG: hypothetical protein ACKKMR_01005 [Candidatus Nealsonbacteria bacterium]